MALQDTTRSYAVGSWFELFNTDLLTTNEDITINVIKPTNYDLSLPVRDVINASSETPTYIRCQLSDNKEFFQNLAQGDLRIHHIDHQNLTDFCELVCDYCHTLVKENGYPVRTCSQCHKDMCSLCWEEKTEAAALANGAQNWKSREQDLLHCFKHLEKFTVIHQYSVCCDTCRVSSRNVFGKWYSNRQLNQDFCPKCNTVFLDDAHIASGWKCVEHMAYQFGSFLDWVLVWKDIEEHDLVLYNINKLSPLYHTVALSAVDDHRREGYFTVPFALEDIEEKLKSTSIKGILEQLGHPTHFG